ncbi:MAG: YlzJ-like protein [Paenibacillus sp.]|jgi:hypothetical protein|nr:YlzJ-like protein [Paenibacillus sp.]
MILYTEVALEAVMEGWGIEPPSYSEVTVNGVLMQVESISPYQGRIVRLYSPEPHHYLNPAYAPGQLIEFKPV